LDARTLLYAVRRHKAVFGVLFLLGLAAGTAFTLIRPPMLASKVLVVVPGTRFIQTQAVIAGSDPVLMAAGRSLHPPIALVTLHHRVSVASVTSTVLAITALGKTAGQAQHIANAVAHSYVTFVKAPKSPGGKASAQVLENATSAVGATLQARMAETGGLGALVGAVIGIIVAAAIGRTDRRIRERDEIAAAIGAPVLASIPVAHPSDTRGWARLLENYHPTVVHAWSLRKALRQLGVTDGKSATGARVSVAVVSLSSDRRALALGPQLAIFASSLGIPTTLVVGPRPESDYTAALSAACTMTATALTGQPGRLRFTVGDSDHADRFTTAALTVIIEVADSRDPRPARAAEATETLLAVSAGAATAEQLARVAVSVTTDGADIAGVLVADPFASDRTTGSLPHLSQPTRRIGLAHQRQTTWANGATTETPR
jgi:capsular polysaccharide biosynthesis protein